MENMENLNSNELHLRPIRKREQAFLERELRYWKQSDLLSDGQAAAISGLYEPAKERFLQVFMGLGGMLVGLGLLSYIAANWMVFGRALKVALIVGGYLLAVLAAYGFESSYPYTSRAFLLIGSFAYGGGIFLISQIFNEGGAITDALFWWMAGTVPACLLFKDRMQLLLIQVIFLVYYHLCYAAWMWLLSSYGSWTWSSLSSVILSLPTAVFAALWILWRRCGNWSVGLQMNILITINIVGIQALRYFNDVTAVFLLLFAVGLFLCVVPLGRLKDTPDGWGISLTGVFGLILSVPDVWLWSRILALRYENSAVADFFDAYLIHWNVSPEVALSVAAAILACMALLWCIHKGSLLATTFFCLMVVRYYFDFFYDFMNKALYFTAGGLLLMAMGFWLQRARKTRQKRKQETQTQTQAKEAAQS